MLFVYVDINYSAFQTDVIKDFTLDSILLPCQKYLLL